MKICIKKQPETISDTYGPFKGMWIGECLTCGDSIRFWFFGATLGASLEHIRRHIANG